jgi:2-methylisocitrate lyase-like PEP mutase family enzyme
MDGKEVISRADAAAKIRAAAQTRSTQSFKIMARTDARATDGLDEALARGDAFLKAGADILFIEAPRSEDELRTVAERFKGVPLVANLVEDGKTPMLPRAVLEAMGYKILLYPVTALLAVTHTLESTFAKLLASEDIAARATFQHYNDVVGLPEWRGFVEAL